MSPRTILIFLLFLCNGMLFAQGADNTHSLKFDLVGIPIGMIYYDGAYPRVSIEYEHAMSRSRKLGWVADFELSRLEETYVGIFSGYLLQGWNEQRTLSAIAGLRYYPFRSKGKRFLDIFFAEPRIAFSGAFARLMPNHTAIPVDHKFGISIRPRFRAGFEVPLTHRIGLELSEDFTVMKLLGSGKNRFYPVFELNFCVAF